MAFAGSVCVEVFKARCNGGFELTVSPPAALGTVEDALEGYYNEDRAVMGHIRVEGLNEDQLCTALGGVATIGKMYEAVDPVETVAAPLS